MSHVENYQNIDQENVKEQHQEVQKSLKMVDKSYLKAQKRLNQISVTENDKYDKQNNLKSQQISKKLKKLNQILKSQITQSQIQQNQRIVNNNYGEYQEQEKQKEIDVVDKKNQNFYDHDNGYNTEQMVQDSVKPHNFSQMSTIMQEAPNKSYSSEINDKEKKQVQTKKGNPTSPNLSLFTKQSKNSRSNHLEQNNSIISNPNISNILINHYSEVKLEKLTSFQKEKLIDEIVQIYLYNKGKQNKIGPELDQYLNSQKIIFEKKQRKRIVKREMDNFISEHQSCGEKCTHLERFYQRVGSLMEKDVILRGKGKYVELNVINILGSSSLKSNK